MSSWRPSQFMMVFLALIFIGWGSYVAWALNLKAEVRALEKAQIQKIVPAREEVPASFNEPSSDSFLAEASHTVREAFSDMFGATGSSGETLVEIINLPTGERTVFETSPDEVSIDSSSDFVSPSLPTLTFCSFAAAQSPSFIGVLINEVAWMGGMSSFNDEWIELKNVSGAAIDISNWQLLDQGGQIAVHFGSGTTILTDGFYLLERSNDDVVSDVSADFIYSGALSNSNEGLRLFDSQCALRDEVFASSSWSAGENDSKRTMERGNNLLWHTFSGGANGGVFGTPRRENSAPVQVATSQTQQNSLQNSQTSQSEETTSSNSSNNTSTPEASSSSEQSTQPTPSQDETSSTKTVFVGDLKIIEVVYDFESVESNKDEGNERIKFKNLTSQNVSLEGLSLQYQYRKTDGALSSFLKRNFNEGSFVSPGNVFVVGANCHPEKKENPTPCIGIDMSWSQALNNSNGAIFLVSNKETLTSIDDENIIDSFSYTATAQ